MLNIVPRMMCASAGMLDRQWNHTEYEGSRLTIRCMEQTSGRSPAREFQGTDGIWEIRSGRNRVFCFFAPGQLMLALGTVKKSAKAKRTDIERAIRMRAEFNERTRER